MFGESSAAACHQLLLSADSLQRQQPLDRTEYAVFRYLCRVSGSVSPKSPLSFRFPLPPSFRHLRFRRAPPLPTSCNCATVSPVLAHLLCVAVDPITASLTNIEQSVRMLLSVRIACDVTPSQFDA